MVRIDKFKSFFFFGLVDSDGVVSREHLQHCCGLMVSNFYELIDNFEFHLLFVCRYKLCARVANRSNTTNWSREFSPVCQSSCFLS